MSAPAVYTPGSWVAVGAESGWLLVDIDPTDPMVLSCWSLIRSGAEIDEILDTVLQRGLRAVSSFALVRLSGTGRRAVVVRGAARADITAGGAGQSISAEGVSTWREVELPPDTSAVRVSSGADGPAAESPLSPGVTLASSIRLAVGADLPAAPPRPDPATAAEPAQATPPPPPPSTPLPRPSNEPAPPPAAESGLPPLPPVPGPPSAVKAAAAGAEAAAAAIPWLSPPAGESMQASEPPRPADASPPTDTPSPEGQTRLPDLPPMPAEEPAAPDPEPDSMAWLAAVKPLEPATDDAAPARPADPPGVVVGGRGIGREEPQQQPQPNGQSFSQQVPAPRPAEGGDSAETTISRASLTGMLDEPGPAGSLVQAVRCQHGHLSPPMAVSCRVCGFPLMGQAPVSVPRPTLGVLRLSTGDVVPLDRGVIMGRNPKLDGADAERPHVVRLPSPGHDISRNHVEIRLDGWHVLLTDLNSVNGTVVTPPWQEPQRLRPNESVPIEPGTVVSLADEVTFRFEVTG